jgi:membrane peptidoglycan carboxypeptidase
VKSRTARVFLRLGVFFESVALIGTAAIFILISYSRVMPTSVDNAVVTGKSEMYANGEKVLIGVFYSEDREPASIKEIPKLIQHAALAAEDANFYHHIGVDFQSIIRAAFINFTHTGDGNQGGSTITQQYVKNLLVYKAIHLPNEAARTKAYNDAVAETITRKVREAQYALHLETIMTKQQIMQGYLNVIGFGGNIYGIKAAAHYYYGKELKDINASEAATLIAIINNPNLYRIDYPNSKANGAANGYSATKARRDYILKAMFEAGHISKQVYDESVASAIAPNITIASSGCFYDKAAFFCDYVKNSILQDPKYGATPEARYNALYNGGLKIYTTLDLTLQDSSLASMQKHVPYTSPTLKIGASSVSIENSTGRILAMVQNKHYSNNAQLAAADDSYTAINFNTSKNYGGSSGFQAGSTFKLFTLIKWLEAGHKLYEGVNGVGNYKTMPANCLPKGYWEGDFNIKNDVKGYDGIIPAMAATAASINTAYLAMANQLDLCDIVKEAANLGVTRADGNPMFIDPTTVIGTNEVSPLAMTGAYSAVGNGGVFCNPTGIDKVLSFTGEVISSNNISCKKVIDPEVDKAVLKALRVTVKFGTVSRGDPKDGTDLFGKTGTTDNAVDTWVIGGSSKVTTGIWVGSTINKVTLWALSANGSSAANYRFQLFNEIVGSADKLYPAPAFSEPNNSFLY